MIRVPFALLLSLCTWAAFGQGLTKVTETKHKLQVLDVKISQLSKVLSLAEDRRSVLDKELSQTNKQMQEGESAIHHIQLSMEATKQKVALMQQEDKTLHQQLNQQQQWLAKHVRARYQMGEYQAMKWLLNQDNPYRVSRLLQYYQYLIQSRQKLINQIDATRKKIIINTEVLHAELQKNQALSQDLQHQQQQLQKDKGYHRSLITALQKEIQQKHKNLEDFQKDKRNLAQLLQTLSQESRVQIRQPFSQMRQKIPYPLHTSKTHLKKTNQGLTFFADEGSQVTAVYPGKVVFSDWLKGYGYLLIIDHGQGFMSLYANNQVLLKHKGDIVQQQESIALVGHSGHSKDNGLYFEIRFKGKAVSPLAWLVPKKEGVG